MFKKLSGDQAILQMAVYLLANLVGIALGLYKVNAMGLLPTSQSDWLEFMVVREVSLYALDYQRTFMLSFCVLLCFPEPGDCRGWSLADIITSNSTLPIKQVCLPSPPF